MFERYTERARRVLFFARYEASQLGSISIETEHLLLGLIREGKPPLAYPPQDSDLFSNIGTVVQWGVIGAIALLVVGQINKQRE